MPDAGYTLAGTGHRPQKLGGFSDATAGRLRDLALALLAREKPDRVISGMALGWDTALALAALDRGIPLVAAIPFEGQERKWPPEAQATFRDILSRAAEVCIVSPGCYAPWKMQVRNEWMVDRATRVAALWDGTGGGTGNCVQYATKRQVEVINLWSTWTRYAYSVSHMEDVAEPGGDVPR